MKSMHEIVVPEIKLVRDTETRNVLLATYDESARDLELIQCAWQRITKRWYPRQALYQFFKNWRNPSVGAGSFCALTCRLLREADSYPADSLLRQDVYLSAIRIAEVSFEDMGLFGPNHGDLYTIMAAGFCGDDQWKLSRYAIPEVTVFLDNARAYRERGPDMMHGLMISLVEELFNHGEFTYIAPLFKGWCNHVPTIDKGQFSTYLQFIKEHVGGTESGHFAKMTDGLLAYSRAHRAKINPMSLGDCNCRYIHGMRESFDRLADAMEESFHSEATQQPTA